MQNTNVKNISMIIHDQITLLNSQVPAVPKVLSLVFKQTPNKKAQFFRIKK